MLINELDTMSSDFQQSALITRLQGRHYPDTSSATVIKGCRHIFEMFMHVTGLETLKKHSISVTRQLCLNVTPRQLKHFKIASAAYNRVLSSQRVVKEAGGELSSLSSLTLQFLSPIPTAPVFGRRGKVKG